MSSVPDHTARQRRVVFGLFIVAVIIAAGVVLMIVGLLLTSALPE
ncbi:hypothetical protein ACIHCQ_38810 [Streptomyces sp. NPDC052236]